MQHSNHSYPSNIQGGHCQRCHSTLARSALTRVSLARFTLATSILTRFQFGAFLFGALPLRRVSLWRASTSARFSLARFPILYLSWCIIGYLIICFPSARVFCEEVLSTPVLPRSHSTIGSLSRITFCVFLLYASYNIWATVKLGDTLAFLVKPCCSC